MSACMQHICRDCGHEWFDNRIFPLCPLCKSSHASHHFDEDPDDDWDDDDDTWIEY